MGEVKVLYAAFCAAASEPEIRRQIRKEVKTKGLRVPFQNMMDQKNPPKPLELQGSDPR